MSGILIAISTATALFTAGVYARAILTGNAKPHRTTRLVLFVITAVSTASLFAGGDTVAVWLAGASFIFSSVILVLSFKYGMGGWAKVDMLSLVIAVVGIVLWQITNDPVIALYLSIGADFTGMVPALIKTYKLPNTESALVFFLGALASLFSLLAVTDISLESISYPLYLLIVNAFMVGLILRPVTKK